MGTIGNHRVVHSSVHAVYPQLGDLTIDIAYGVTLTIRFISNGGPISGNGVLASSHVTLDLMNYDNPLGSTYDMQIALADGSTLNMMVVVHTIGTPPQCVRNIVVTAIEQ